MEKRRSIKDIISLMNKETSAGDEISASAGSNNGAPARSVGKLDLKKFSSPIPPTAESPSPATAEGTVVDDNGSAEAAKGAPASASEGTRRLSVKDRIAAMSKSRDSAEPEAEAPSGGSSVVSVEPEKKLTLAERMALYQSSSARNDGSHAPSKGDGLSPETVQPAEEDVGDEDIENLSVAKRLALMRKKEKKEVVAPPPAVKRPSAVAERIAAIQPPKPPSPKAAAEPRKPASSIAERMAMFKAKEAAEPSAPALGTLNRRASIGNATLGAPRPAVSAGAPAAKTAAARAPAAAANTPVPSESERGKLNRRASTGTTALPADFSSGGMSIADRIAAMKKKPSSDDANAFSATEKPPVSKLKRTPTGELEMFNSAKNEQEKRDAEAPVDANAAAAAAESAVEAAAGAEPVVEVEKVLISESNASDSEPATDSTPQE